MTDGHCLFDIFRENKFFTEYDSQLDTYVLDEDAFLDHLEVEILWFSLNFKQGRAQLQFRRP